jgi:hypothetical protein
MFMKPIFDKRLEETLASRVETDAIGSEVADRRTGPVTPTG